jgi:ferredoxin-NADP reductase
MGDKPTYQVKLLHKVLIAREMLELRFEKPAGFTFTAGQFVQFFIPHGMESVLRSYSISSHPQEDYLEFCVKLVPEGKGATFFNNLSLGSIANFRGPEGRFVCEPHHDRSKLFVATGAGIAPIISMIEQELKTVPDISITLLFGVRSETDLFWTERLQKLQTNFPSFTYQITLSQPSESWSGLRGRVTEHLSEISEMQEYYLCGSLEMVKDARTILQKKKVELKKVHLEIF